MGRKQGRYRGDFRSKSNVLTPKLGGIWVIIVQLYTLPIPLKYFSVYTQLIFKNLRHIYKWIHFSTSQMNEEPHNLFSLYGEEKNPVIPKQPTSSFKDTGREVWREEKRNALCPRTLLIFLHTLSSFKFFWSPTVYQKQKTNKQKQHQTIEKKIHVCFSGLTVCFSWLIWFILSCRNVRPFFGLWNESFRKNHFSCTIENGVEEGRIAERPVAGIQASNHKAEAGGMERSRSILKLSLG